MVAALFGHKTKIERRATCTEGVVFLKLELDAWNGRTKIQALQVRYCRILGIGRFDGNMRLEALLHYRVVWHSEFRYVSANKIYVKMRIRRRLVAKHVIPFEVLCGRTRCVCMIWEVTWIPIINGLTLLNLLHDLLRELVARSYQGCVVVKDFAFGHAAESGEGHELVAYELGSRRRA